MNVEFKNSKKEVLIENLWDGDLFVYNDEPFITLTDELLCSDSESKYNAVNLRTGEPEFFTSNTKVICPIHSTITIEH